MPASETEPLIALSSDGARTMEQMKRFLGNQVFRNERMTFRTETLEAITETALNVLYRSYEGELPKRIERLALHGGWAEQNDQLDLARSNVKDPVNRVQVVVNVLASMSDREVFELVGLE